MSTVPRKTRRATSLKRLVSEEYRESVRTTMSAYQLRQHPMPPMNPRVEVERIDKAVVRQPDGSRWQFERILYDETD